MLCPSRFPRATPTWTSMRIPTSARAIQKVVAYSSPTGPSAPRLGVRIASVSYTHLTLPTSDLV